MLACHLELAGRQDALLISSDGTLVMVPKSLLSSKRASSMFTANFPKCTLSLNGS
jgi:hypothetical protein